MAAPYRSLLQHLDRWFAESAARSGVVPCRRGCSACCRGPFDISVADTALVIAAVGELPPEAQATIRSRAREQVVRMGQLEPGWDVLKGTAGIGDEDFDRVSEGMALEPCPLLDDEGVCRIYESRPLVCRMTGLGMVTPAGRVIENQCPIMAEFPGYPALPPQPFDLETLEDAETACLETAAVTLFGTPDQAGFETTIAAAIARFS